MLMTVYRQRKCVKKTRQLQDLMESFGGRLKLALERAGHDQRWLANTLGVREGTVSAWVSGPTLPEGKVMVKLPELLGVSGHWLLTGEGPEQVVEPGAAEKKLEAMKKLAMGDMDTVIEYFMRMKPDADKGKNSA